MKNLQKGFVVPVILVAIALLVIGGGVFVYKSKKVETPAVVDTGTQQTNTDSQFTITWPTSGVVLVAGKTYTITWTGIDSHIKGYEMYLWKESQQALDGHQGTGYVSIIASSINTVPVSKRSFSWTVPFTLKAGDDYHIDFANVSYPANGRSAKFTIVSSDTPSANQGEYKNQNYGLSVNYSNDAWVLANDVGMYLLNKETNFETLLTLVKKSPQNGKQCTDANSGKSISCNSTLESIKFAIINKTLGDVRSSIPSYALTGYDGHGEYKSTCAPLDLPIYLGKKPSVCAFSGFEWDEHAEYLYSIGNKTLVVNWNYYDVDKNVFLISEKNFLDVMKTLKLGE